MTKRLFIFGYGYTANALCKKLRAKSAWSITATTRNPDKAASLNHAGITTHVWDGGTIDIDWLAGANHMLISTPPTDLGCPALIAGADAIAKNAKNFKWIGYLSTNGVYGDCGGEWVDETSKINPTTERAARRAEAEAAWKALAAAHDLPLIIFRLPSIYGPGRSALENVQNGTAKRIFKKGQVFSRMHVDDIAYALAASMARQHSYDLYNLADDEPAPPQDVVNYACELLQIEPPPLVPLEEAEMSDMAKSFYADNKRVSNRRMKTTLGIELTYPTYREGLKALFTDGNF